MSPDPLRPKSLSEFSGQPEVSKELTIILSSALSRRVPPPHVLLSGPPGLGKTTLAAIIAAESSLPFVATSAPSLEKPGDLVAVLVGLNEPSVVFIDEIHQLPRAVEETLYSAMEDGAVDVILPDTASSARAITLSIQPFTLVGATTLAGALGAPFRDRFGYTARLRPYDVPTLTSIIQRNAEVLGLSISRPGAELIASRSRGTPRVANRLLGRVFDWVTVKGLSRVDVKAVSSALETFGVDSLGLDRVDILLLRALCEDFGGGPVGLSTLAASTGESESTIETAHEPFLMRSGLLARTPKGRIATSRTFLHLGLTPPGGQDEDTTNS